MDPRVMRVGADQIRNWSTGPQDRGPDPADGPRPVYRRHQSGRPGLRIRGPSQYAHGVLTSIDTTAARAMPGVLAVYTSEDLGAYGSIRCVFRSRTGTARRCTSRTARRWPRTRSASWRPGCIRRAETAVQARDAAEAVEVEIDALPAVTDAAAAAEPDCPASTKMCRGMFVSTTISGIRTPPTRPSRRRPMSRSSVF